MSKEQAMAIATGQPVTNVNPSLITGDMTKGSLTPELAPTETPEASKKVQESIDSDRFAIIAKKEAKLVKDREEFKKRQADVEAKELKAKEFLEKIEAFEAKKKVDPIDALKFIGFTETDIFNFMANKEEPKEPTAEEIAEKVAKKQLDEYKEEQLKIAADAQRAKEQGLVTEYSTKISSAIKADPEKYEYSNYYGKQAEELAIEFATANVKLNDELLSPEEVAQEVEDYYEEQDKAMSALKKRQPKVEATSADSPKQEPVRTRTVTPPIGAAAPSPSKTLTNKATATVASTITRKETHEQKKERLISALKAGTYVMK